MSSARDLADRFHERWLRVNPFAATMYGIPGYDHLLPDDSEDAHQAWRAESGEFVNQAAAIDRARQTPADAVTLDCTAEAAAREVAVVDLAAEDHTVTPMHYSLPAVFLAVAARTVLLDQTAADAFLTRVRGSGAWIDQVTGRLRAGAGRGRLPVAPLAEQAISWAETVLASPDSSPVLSRWVAAVRELLPRARPADHAGLHWLPGGDADYASAIRVYTTLPLSAEELHQTGLDHVAALEDRAVKLGARLGLSGRDEVFAALRESAGKIPPEEAVARALAAVRRAEERAPEFFPAPLPPPCEVTPMPEVVALSGAAPHYTPPG